MHDEQFSEIIEEAVTTLPEEFREKIENVEIVVADLPDIYQVQKLKKRDHGMWLLGLYEGIPHTRRGHYGIGPTLPDKITIFKIPLMRISSNKSELKRNIKNTVIHEIGHHFGLSDEEIYNAQRKRGENSL